eukprot:8341494-Pyramimonas_sp.AAC.1
MGCVALWNAARYNRVGRRIRERSSDMRRRVGCPEASSMSLLRLLRRELGTVFLRRSSLNHTDGCS